MLARTVWADGSPITCLELGIELEVIGEVVLFHHIRNSSVSKQFFYAKALTDKDDKVTTLESFKRLTLVLNDLPYHEDHKYQIPKQSAYLAIIRMPSSFEDMKSARIVPSSKPISRKRSVSIYLQDLPVETDSSRLSDDLFAICLHKL